MPILLNTETVVIAIAYTFQDDSLPVVRDTLWN
jgi:hypothetical protein